MPTQYSVANTSGVVQGYGQPVVLIDGENRLVSTASGYIGTVDYGLHAGEDTTLDRQWGGFKGQSTSSAWISSATNTSLKTSAGVLHNVVLCSTAAGAITIYNNTSAAGSVIAVLKASIVEGTYSFDIAFSNGLVISTAAASQLSVSFI